MPRMHAIQAIFALADMYIHIQQPQQRDWKYTHAHACITHLEHVELDEVPGNKRPCTVSIEVDQHHHEECNDRNGCHNLEHEEPTVFRLIRVAQAEKDPQHGVRGPKDDSERSPAERGHSSVRQRSVVARWIVRFLFLTDRLVHRMEI